MKPINQVQRSRSLKRRNEQAASAFSHVTRKTNDKWTQLIKEEKGHGLIRNSIDTLVLSSFKQCLGLIVICDTLKLFWETAVEIRAG